MFGVVRHSFEFHKEDILPYFRLVGATVDTCEIEVVGPEHIQGICQRTSPAVVDDETHETFLLPGWPGCPGCFWSIRLEEFRNWEIGLMVKRCMRCFDEDKKSGLVFVALLDARR